MLTRKRKPSPREHRPVLPRGKDDPQPEDIVAPPKSAAQYELAKRRLLDDLYGHSIEPCKCGWPRLKGYHCRKCNSEL